MRQPHSVSVVPESPTCTMKLRIQHRTTYRYAEKVLFGPHRMMLRPREGHDIQIEQSVLEVTPAHRTDWLRDVYGNSIAVAHFNERASELMVYSDLTSIILRPIRLIFILKPRRSAILSATIRRRRCNSPPSFKRPIPATRRAFGNGSANFGARDRRSTRSPCCNR
jgi:hypothetical protein